MQFHPSLLWCNGEAKGLVSEAVRGAGGIFVDAQRRPIMKGVHPQLDLAPRHITAYTLFKKNELPDTKHILIFLPFSNLKKNFLR